MSRERGRGGFGLTIENWMARGEDAKVLRASMLALSELNRDEANGGHLKQDLGITKAQCKRAEAVRPAIPTALSVPEIVRLTELYNRMEAAGPATRPAAEREIVSAIMEMGRARRPAFSEAQAKGLAEARAVFTVDQLEALEGVSRRGLPPATGPATLLFPPAFPGAGSFAPGELGAMKDDGVHRFESIDVGFQNEGARMTWVDGREPFLQPWAATPQDPVLTALGFPGAVAEYKLTDDQVKRIEALRPPTSAPVSEDDRKRLADAFAAVGKASAGEANEAARKSLLEIAAQVLPRMREARKADAARRADQIRQILTPAQREQIDRMWGPRG